MAKIHRDIWGKATYVNLNFNSFINTGCSLNQNIEIWPQCIIFNVLPENEYTSKWLRKTHGCKLHWIIHVCISCVVTESESIYKFRFYRALSVLNKNQLKWIKLYIYGNFSCVDCNCVKKTHSCLHWISKPGYLTTSQKQICAGVMDWFICEITGGEQALNANCVRLKSFQIPGLRDVRYFNSAWKRGVYMIMHPK